MQQLQEKISSFKEEIVSRDSATTSTKARLQDIAAQLKELHTSVNLSLGRAPSSEVNKEQVKSKEDEGDALKNTNARPEIDTKASTQMPSDESGPKRPAEPTDTESAKRTRADDAAQSLSLIHI